MYITISLLILLRNRKFSEKVAQKIKLYILCSTPFFTENLDVYEIIWKNVVNLDRPA
jgi:hypothetical protein